MAALDVPTLANGDTTTAFYNMSTTLIDPVADTVAIANDDVGDTFHNGTDRRTFLLVKNGNAENHFPEFKIPRTFGAASNSQMYKKTDPDPTVGGHQSQGWVSGGMIDAGDTKLYGPFPSYWCNDANGDVAVRFKRHTTFVSNAGSGIVVLPVYCPAYDDIAKSTSTADGGSSLTVPISVAVDVAVQTISINGVEPTFVGHTSDNGWLLPLANDGKPTTGTRRLFWLANSTGENIPMIIVPGYYSGILSDVILGSGSVVPTLGPAYQWATINTGTNVLAGTWDHRVWAGGYDPSKPNALWLRGAATGTFLGTSANLKIAWFELPA